MRRSCGCSGSLYAGDRAQPQRQVKQDWRRDHSPRAGSGTAKAFARMQRNNSTRQESAAYPTRFGGRLSAPAPSRESPPAGPAS